MADKKVQYVNVVYKADTQQFTTNVNKAKNSMDKLATSVDKVDKQSKQAKDSVGKIGDGANKSASGLDKLGISAGVSASVMSSIINIAGQVVSAMVNLGKQAVSLASDYQENLSKTEAVFGSNAEHFIKMANTITGATGLSKNAFLEQVSLYGAMAKAMGVSTDQTVEMSEQLTRLSADMSSFYNKDIEQVSTALKGVFTGETEALKEFGIVMTETNLKAFADDIGVSYNELNQAGKVMLRYKYIMEQTKVAQGDYQRTSTGLANSTRTLKANFENLLTTIGTNFLGALEQPMNAINNAFKLATQSQADFDEQIKQAQTSTESAKQALANLDQQLKDGKISQQEYQEEYKRLTDTISQNDAFVQQTEKLKQSQEQLKPIFDSVKGFFDEWVKGLMTTFQIISIPIKLIGQLFVGMIQGIMPHLQPIVDQLTPIWQKLNEIFQTLIVNNPLIQMLGGVIQRIGQAIGTVLGGALRLVLPFINTFLNALKNVVSFVTSFVYPIFDFVKNGIFAIMDAYNGFVNTIIAWTSGIVNSINGAFQNVQNAVYNVVMTITGYWNNFIAFISGIGGIIWNAIISGFQGISNWVYNNVIAPIQNFFSNLGSQITSGISSAIDTVKGWFGLGRSLDLAFIPYQNYSESGYGSRTLNTTYNYNIYTKADPTLDFISRQKAMVEGGQAYAFNRPRF